MMSGKTILEEREEGMLCDVRGVITITLLRLV